MATPIFTNDYGECSFFFYHISPLFKAHKRITILTNIIDGIRNIIRLIYNFDAKEKGNFFVLDNNMVFKNLPRLKY